MASFENVTIGDIPSAILLTELIPLHPIKSRKYPAAESWCCAFSPDESYFAWSSGNGIISIVPWAFCKSTLFKYKEVTVPFKLGDGILVDSTHEEVDCFGCSTISVYTGHLIRSLAFGLSNRSYGCSPSSPFWSRFSASKDLVLATGHLNGRIRLWDVFTGKLILELLDHKDMVSQLQFSPTGNLVLASASYDGTLKVWDLHEDGNMFQTLKMNNKPIYSCCWSPDARSLVSVGMCKLVYVWDTRRMRVRLKLEGHLHDVVACVFSTDGSLIATASWDTRVILWNSFNGHIIKSFNHLQPSPHPIFACGDNGTWIRDVSFSSDGAHLATVADDGYLRFWDISSDKSPEAIAVVENSLSCTFAPSSRVLAVGNKKGPVTFWTAPLCIKPLLFLSRTAIRKVFSPEHISHLSVPKSLVDFLLYKDL